MPRFIHRYRIFGFIFLAAFGLSKSFCFAEQTNGTLAQGQTDNMNLVKVDTLKSAWWYGGQAKENYDKRNYENAITDFSKAIYVDPEIAEFYYYRAHSYAFTNQPVKALADFKKALELNPDYSSKLNNMGWEFLKDREFFAALRYFFNHLKLMVSDPKIFFGVNLNANYLNLLNNLGWESFQNKELPKAIRYFNNYLKMVPSDPDAFLGLALVYYDYGDTDNALLYLDKAKKAEPALYQGVSGLVKLEKSGCSYSVEDKKLLTNLFNEVGNKSHDLKNLTTTASWKFLLGFTYLVLGILALVIFILRIRRNEGFILILSVLNLLFGFKFLYENPLIQLSVLSTFNFWIYIMPIISASIPIAFILFIRYFIGWGWRKSILWLFIYSILQGIFKVMAEYSAPAQDIYGTTNIIFGWMAVLVLFLHLFRPGMRKDREVQIISVGLGFYLLAVFYENLTRTQWLSNNFSFDEPAYLFFNICLVYVAFKRITDTEKEYLTVKQDLETARSIQNAILPGVNPRGDMYEVSSAYLPMALIGGDYFDYQMPEDSYIGVLIADVSGHGISAALIASMMKVAFSSQRNNARSPATVLQQMNHSLTGQLNNEFITAGYLGIDLNKLVLTCSSAGHPPLLVYRRPGDEITELKVQGIPIGVYPETSFNESKMQLAKGDRLILYTDGILDVFSTANEPFGRQRLLNVIKETKNLLPDDAIDGILHSLQKWSGKSDGETYEDDITLIIFDII